MARQTDITELRKLLTAMSQMQSWQNELLAKACDIVGPVDKSPAHASKTTRPRKASKSRNALAGQAKARTQKSPKKKG